MTDTENLFAEMFDMQAGHEMVIVRADDAREVMVLLGEILDNTAFMYRSTGHGWQCPYCDEISPLMSKNRSETVHTEDCVYRRIERVLAAHEPREKAVSDG